MEHIKARGGQAIAVQADVFTSEGCRELFDETCKQFGRVDICVIGPGGVGTASRWIGCHQRAWPKMSNTSWRRSCI